MAAAEVQGFEANAEHYLYIKAVKASKTVGILSYYMFLYCISFCIFVSFFLCEASRKEKGRETFGRLVAFQMFSDVFGPDSGSPFFLRPLPKHLMNQLREAGEVVGGKSKSSDSESSQKVSGNPPEVGWRPLICEPKPLGCPPPPHSLAPMYVRTSLASSCFLIGFQVYDLR